MAAFLVQNVLVVVNSGCCFVVVIVVDQLFEDKTSCGDVRLSVCQIHHAGYNFDFFHLQFDIRL